MTIIAHCSHTPRPPNALLLVWEGMFIYGRRAAMLMPLRVSMRLTSLMLPHCPSRLRKAGREFSPLGGHVEDFSCGVLPKTAQDLSRSIVVLYPAYPFAQIGRASCRERV